MRLRNFRKFLVAISLSSLYTISTFAAVVTDVKTNHWAYAAIVKLEEKGIVSYNSKGQFFPDKQMTYFEVADVIARATGYVDVAVATNVDENFKQQIQANYQKQKQKLDSYAAKYSKWDKLYDQQVAYILGRGYISSLDGFISTSGNTQAQAKMTKQNLAVILVRMLGKEETAKSTYTTTGFKDENMIATANRPYVAYLKSIGVITPDAKGNCNPNTVVTKALCAKMVNDVLNIRGEASSNVPAPTTPTYTDSTAAQSVTVKKVLAKNASEFYLYLDRNGNSSYYSIKNTTPVTDANGSVIAISDIPVDSTALVTIQLEAGTEYVTSMKLVSGANTNTNVNQPVNTDSNSVTGTLSQNITSNIVRITLADGTSKVCLLGDYCTVTLNGAISTASQLSAGDKVVASVEGNTVTSINAIKGTGSVTVGGVNTGSTTTSLNSGEVTARQTTLDGYNLTIKSGNIESTVFVPDSAALVRNQKSKDIGEVRIGDQVQLTKEGNVISQIVATGEQSSVEGTIKEIHLAQPGRIVVNTGSDTITYTLTDATEIYDNNTRKYIDIRNLHLGQEVELLLESKEVVSLDIVKGTNSVSFKGTIQSISKGNDYMEVLIDYDPISGATKVYKRVQIPNSVTITKNSSEVSRSKLEEGMDVVLTYEYLDDAAPKKIIIVK